MVRARWLVNTLSRIGEAIAEATMPASSNVAPMKPERSSEYPCGEKYWAVRMEKVFMLRRGLRHVNSQEKGTTYAPAWTPNTRTEIQKSNFSRVDIRPYSASSPLESPANSFKRARCDLSWAAAYAAEPSVHRKMQRRRTTYSEESAVDPRSGRRPELPRSR